MAEASGKLEISLPLVTDLIVAQFPQWAHLPIKPIEPSGWDNKTFRLGEEMSIRLPSTEAYAPQVQKEQKWLSLLAPCLTCPIPKPLAVGRPSINYPWHWSVYQWIEGENAEPFLIDDLQLFALNLAQFLKELHKIDTTGGPLPGAHNFYRGASPLVYDAETRSTISQLRGFFDINAVTAVWEKAISSKWTNNPLWIHGDFSAGNILLRNGQLAAVIDFGCMGIGDPACDLVIAWTLLTKESRKVFKSHLCLDSATWARARGWALWKSLITLFSLENKSSPEAMKIQRVVEEILNEYRFESCC